MEHAREPDAPQHLLMVTQFYWPESVGIAVYATDKAEWFAERGWDVDVVTARPNYPTFRVRPEYAGGGRDRETVRGVRLRRLPTWAPRGGGVVRRIVHELRLATALLGNLSTGRIPRARHVVSFCPSILLVGAANRAVDGAGRHVAVVHDIPSGLATGLGLVRAGALARLMRSVECRALNRATRVVVLTDEMKQRLRAQGVRTAIEVLPLWIDPRRIFPFERRAGAPPIVTYSGNLGRKQGLGLLLEMADVLRAQRPDITVVIRGDGSQGERLRQRASRRGLVNVRFEPLVPPERLNESLAACDVQLVPQLPEGSDSAIPSKVFNILAAGRTFVCTARPGSTLWRLQQASDAFVCCPPGEPNAFARAVVQLVDDPERRRTLGDRGRRYVAANFSRDVILSRFAELLAPGSSGVTAASRGLPSG